MKKIKFQAIIFGALFLIGIVIWFYPALVKGTAGKISAIGKFRAADVTELTAVKNFFEEQKSIEQKRPTLSLKRDPFSLPQIGEAEQSEPVLSGIAVDEKGRIAIINGEIAREGDVIMDSKIIKIEKDSVIIEKDGNEITLKIYEEEK